MFEDTSKIPPLTSSSTPTPTNSNSIKDIDVFRKPLPPAPIGQQQPPSSRRQKRKILEEEKFVQDLGHIIERDFFPDIKRLRAKEKYLTALEKNDVVTLRELYAKYSIHRGPSPSPSMMGQRDTPSSSFETPIDREPDTPKTMKDDKLDELSSKHGEIDEDEEHSDKQSVTSTNRKKVRDLRLDQYLSINTSEDNISFEQIMEETQKKERSKDHQAWLYKQQALTHSSGENAITHELPVPSIEDQAKMNNPDNAQFWPYTVKNAVMYFPEGAQLTAAEKIEQAKHVRSIHHTNTRFEVDPFTIASTIDSSSRVATPARPNALLRPQIDIDGREIKRLESPQVGGYGFVVTPSPMPGAHGDESPMMTWGQIEGTPFCLDAGNETPSASNGGPQFKIIETPFREQLALELVEKNAAQHRKKKT
jgi:protein DGCR14